jgi:hypothetical protein
LGHQPGEPTVQRMIGRDERLLAMENRRVNTGWVFEAVDRTRAKRELDASLEGWVAVGWVPWVPGTPSSIIHEVDAVGSGETKGARGLSIVSLELPLFISVPRVAVWRPRGVRGSVSSAAPCPTAEP